MAAKSINWAAIKKRYLQGDKPKDIAADFGLTAKQVSNRAVKQNWGSKKEQIGAKIEQKIEEEVIDEISSLRARVLAEYEYLAFSRLNRLSDWGKSDVSLKDSKTLADGDVAAVAEVSQTKEGVKIKLHKKEGALDKLAEYTGLIKSSQEPESASVAHGDLPIEFWESLSEAQQREYITTGVLPPVSDKEENKESG